MLKWFVRKMSWNVCHFQCIQSVSIKLLLILSFKFFLKIRAILKVCRQAFHFDTKVSRRPCKRTSINREHYGRINDGLVTVTSYSECSLADQLTMVSSQNVNDFVKTLLGCSWTLTADCVSSIYHWCYLMAYISPSYYKHPIKSYIS